MTGDGAHATRLESLFLLVRGALLCMRILLIWRSHCSVLVCVCVGQRAAARRSARTRPRSWAKWRASRPRTATRSCSRCAMRSVLMRAETVDSSIASRVTAGAATGGQLRVGRARRRIHVSRGHCAVATRRARASRTGFRLCLMYVRAFAIRQLVLVDSWKSPVVVVMVSRRP